MFAQNIILRMLNATVARALSSWVDTVTSRKAIEAKIKRVLYKWTHGTITLAFNQWTMGIDIRKRQGLVRVRLCVCVHVHVRVCACAGVFVCA